MLIQIELTVSTEAEQWHSQDVCPVCCFIILSPDILKTATRTMFKISGDQMSARVTAFKTGFKIIENAFQYGKRNSLTLQ